MSDAPYQDPPPKIVGAVANAISILRSLAQLSEPAGVNVIARDANVSVSTCFNILRTLAAERLVDFDPEAKTYRIGMGVLEFSVPLLGADQANVIRPELGRLSEEHRSLICLWQVTGAERIVLVDRICKPRMVRVDISDGSRLPAFAGAVGRCYAALRELPQAELQAKFDALSWQDPPTFQSYLADVEQARRDGYAFDFGHLFRGLEIAASLVTDHTGKARLGISGISIAGQLTREEVMRLGVDIRNSADWISEVLFGVARGSRHSARAMAEAPAEPRVRRRQS